MHTPTEQTAPLRISDQPLTFRHWSINGRFLGRNITGVDRYAREILRAMDALIGEGHPLAAGLTLDILCPDGAIGESPFANIPLRVLPKVPGHLWEQFILTGYLRGGLLSLCNTGPLAVKRQIVCIHDVNTRLAPESYGFMFRATYRLLQPALGRRAARIVTVSRFSQKAMAQFGIAPADEIEVIHDGYEHVLEWNAGLLAAQRSGSTTPLRVAGREQGTTQEYRHHLFDCGGPCRQRHPRPGHWRRGRQRVCARARRSTAAEREAPR